MVVCKENEFGIPLEVEKVALSDLDCSLKLEGEKLLNARIGNVMWRSPEALAGKGIGKPSDVFSYGLLVSWSFFHPSFHHRKDFLCLSGLLSSASM